MPEIFLSSIYKKLIWYWDEIFTHKSSLFISNLNFGGKGDNVKANLEKPVGEWGWRMWASIYLGCGYLSSWVELDKSGQFSCSLAFEFSYYFYYYTELWLCILREHLVRIYLCSMGIGRYLVIYFYISVFLNMFLDWVFRVTK